MGLPSISEIRHWNPDALEALRDKAQQALQTLTREGDGFARLKLTAADWDGEAASRSMRAHDQLVEDGDHHAAGLGAVVKGIERAVDAIPSLHRLIHEAEELARKYGYRVGDNGELTDLFEGKDPPKDMHPEDRARAKKEVIAKLEQVKRTATDVDNDLTAVFDKAGAGLYGIGQTGNLSTAATAGSHAVTASPPAPPKHGTPAQNAAWWRSLSGNERNTIIQHAPDQIGNLNGVPAEARSKANIKRLPQMKKRLLQKRDKLRNRLAGRPNTSDTAAVRNQLSIVEGKLKSLNQVHKTMDKNDGHHRQLMLLDDSHKRLEAGIGIGDVDKAKHVAVFTPGMNSTVDDGLGEYDDDMRKLTEESDDMSDRHGDGGKTASVTWIGYQAPQTGELANPLHSAASPYEAMSAGHDLNEFNKGIEASREGTDAGSPHMTAIGHSYGSAATGASIGNSDTPVDDVMLMGSPGIMTHDAKVPDGHVYSEWAKDDSVPYTNMGGTLGPNTYDHTNSELLSTDAHTGPDGPMREATGHGVTGGYLADNTTSQHNTAAVVTGNEQLAQHSTPDEFKHDRLGY